MNPVFVMTFILCAGCGGARSEADTSRDSASAASAATPSEVTGKSVNVDQQKSPVSAMAMPASLAPTFPRVGVDYKATYALWRGWGPKNGDRWLVTRRGAFVKSATLLIATLRAQEDAVVTSFADLSTGSSVSIVRDARSRLKTVNLTQGVTNAAQFPIYRHTLVRTKKTQNIIGEQCTVWRAEPETSDGVAHTACITDDGITLRETVLYHDGKIMNENRALSVDRGPVALAEVLPPVDALDWDRWISDANGSVGKNYSITLVGSNRRSEATRRTLIADGVSRADEMHKADILTKLTTMTGLVTVSYFRDERREMLSISRAAQGRASKSVVLDQIASDVIAPLLTRKTMQVLGEDCRWFNATVGYADYSRADCRTLDDLPLIIEENSWGSTTSSTATSLTRGQTPTGSIRPPAGLLLWAYWGWQRSENSQ